MKTKKFDKKLVLSKETIASLDNLDMKELQGGALTIGPRCKSVEPCTQLTTICYQCITDEFYTCFMC